MALVFEFLFWMIAVAIAVPVLVFALRRFGPRSVRVWLDRFIARFIVAEEPLPDDETPSQKDERRTGAKNNGQERRGILLTLRLGKTAADAAQEEARTSAAAAPRAASRREQGGGGNRGGRY